MVQYRKSKKVGPFRFTVSQRGISSSVGYGPLRISHGADGKVRRTVRVPGTGIYDTKVIGPQGLGLPQNAAGQPGRASKSNTFEEKLARIWLTAALLVVTAFPAVIAWALFSTGHWLLGCIAALVTILGLLAGIGKLWGGPPA